MTEVLSFDYGFEPIQLERKFMLVYLDSRDLINVLASDAPVSVEELGRILNDRDAQLVYSFSNVIETVSFGDRGERKRRLESLAALPKTFILGLPPLLRLEFMQALLAYYGDMRNVPRIDPFRGQWHQSLSHKALPSFGTKSMSEVVMQVLAENPDIGKNTVARLQEHMVEVEADRAVGAGQRSKWSWFRSGVANTLIRCGVGQLPVKDLEPFCRWLILHGDACPGWRLFSNAHSSFTNNVTDDGEPSDPPDYSHMTAIPYVDAATLDRRMRGYYKQAIARLQDKYPGSSYFARRVFPDLAAWINS